MEKHPRSESILLGFSPQISFGNPASSSPTVSDGNSDIDFNDVFGGPPRRRSSISESRYSLNENADSFLSKPDAEPVASRNLWSGLSDKPVFGEEPAYSRRHPGDGFFDDIFKSESSGASTPKRHDRDPFSPMSSSLVLSPVRPLPPMAETFESPSLTAKFSLPARVAGGINVSLLGSATHSSSKHKGAAFSEANHSYSPSLPRFSSLSSQAQEDAIHDIQSLYRPSLSSQGLSQNREDPSRQENTDGTNIGSNLEMAFKSAEDSINESQFPFHFSIYKWANKEVSFTMPPTRGHVPRSKPTAKTRRCSSSNGRMVTENNAKQSPTSTTLGNSDCPSGDHPLTSTDFFKLRPENEGSDSIWEETNQQSKKRPQIIEKPILPKPQQGKTSSLHKTADRALLHHSRREAKYAGGYGLEESNQNKQKPFQIVEEPVLSKSESVKVSSVQETVDCAPLKHSRREEKVNSFIDIRFSERTEKELPECTKEAVKHESQSAHPIVDDNKAKGAKETLILDDGNEIKAKSNRRSPLSFDRNKILKKEDGEATMVRKTEVEKSTSQSSSSNSGLSADRQRVGKVKEFVKIFNQDLPSTAKAGMDNHSPSAKQKHRGNSGTAIEVGATTKTDQKAPLQNLNNTVANVSVKVDEPSKEQPTANTAFSKQNSPAESVPEDSKITVVDIDEEIFQENFLIKELPQDEIKQPRMEIDGEEIKAIDAKIRQWSRGKEGNIRSLLSTLQYVLWPESGWKPVPLVDIVDGNAVKRSYQRALLCLHPDKLQQRGVTSQQKYTAEKVFDILQEAWTLFSSLGLS